MRTASPEHQTRRAGCRRNQGFSLLEVLVATALLTGGLAAIAQLFLVVIDANQWSGTATTTAALAAERLEQLRSLAFYVDETGAAVTDCASDLSVTPPSSAGGRGLLASPAVALSTNTLGYVDYLDAAGRWLGNGATAPQGAAFVRRWSVTPLPAQPSDAVILQVAVMRASAAAAAASMRVGDAVVVSLKARRSR